MKCIKTLLIIFLLSVVFSLLFTLAEAMEEATEIQYMSDKINQTKWNEKISKIQSKYNETSYVVKISVYEYIPRYCGYYYLSGVVHLSTDDFCNEVYGFDVVFVHEARHLLWHNMPFDERIEYCNYRGYHYQDNSCWELFAWDW